MLFFCEKYSFTSFFPNTALQQQEPTGAFIIQSIKNPFTDLQLCALAKEIPGLANV